MDSAPRDLHEAEVIRSRVSVLQHEGCESALACAALSPPRGRRALLRQLKAGHQHRVLRLHGTPALGNTHGSALLMRWAWPMSTAATARPGAPFVQKGEPFRGALPVEKSARVPAPKGAITCSPRSGRKISARRLESQSSQRWQRVKGPGMRANGRAEHACSDLGCPVELSACAHW